MPSFERGYYSAGAYSTPTEQTPDWKTYYTNIGWQVNIPINNTFANKANGWEAYVEGSYYFTRNIALGGFVSYNTNNEYIPRRIYPGNSGSSFSTDMQHSLFQIPFGLSERYRFLPSIWRPYVGIKNGTNYAKFASYLNTVIATEETWEFYVSPEIGLSTHSFRNCDIGLQCALYYSYATNRNKAFQASGLNNARFKLGIAC
ncbi:MAG: porin family protein [Alistipes sp.]|uniref:porin family protein n=1 Tax=Alistipes sp. TaxID=1872444 RepID=UPI0025BD0FAD|nr:porin family protein [Alistipes sp.]MCD7795799.1 porin family protein [Alistipes sp.]MCD8275072.1 porin family protein [Alistipes sp.]